MVLYKTEAPVNSAAGTRPVILGPCSDASHAGRAMRSDLRFKLLAAANTHSLLRLVLHQNLHHQWQW